MLIVAAPLAALAQAPVVQPASATAQADNAAQTRVRDRPKMQKKLKIEAPDAALIEYLGDYEDAADGLDPIGLADQPEALLQDGKDGHQQ